MYVLMSTERQKYRIWIIFVVVAFGFVVLPHAKQIFTVDWSLRRLIYSNSLCWLFFITDIYLFFAYIHLKCAITTSQNEFRHRFDTFFFCRFAFIFSVLIFCIYEFVLSIWSGEYWFLRIHRLSLFNFIYSPSSKWHFFRFNEKKKKIEQRSNFRKKSWFSSKNRLKHSKHTYP